MTKRHQPPTRVLIIVFDALRPDMVSAQTMPNLHAFAQRGLLCTSSRSVFPSETRVNQAALVTGCYPAGNGIVANRFVELTASPDALFNTGDEDALRLADERLNGALLNCASLGECLNAESLSLATISSGTPGGGRILNHRASEHAGSFRLAMHRPDATVPADAYDELVRTIGPIPPHEIPSLDWLRWATDAWLQYVEPKVKPDVGIVWFCEPDNSYHYCGIGAPENLEALAQADRQFARLLQAYKQELDDGSMQIITMSDHGQLAVSGEAVGIEQVLTEAGLKVGAVPTRQSDLAVSVDSAGGLFCRDRDPKTIELVMSVLSNQPWCGALADQAGTRGISLADLGHGGPRAPDIALVLKADDQTGPFGWPGTSVHDAGYPTGGGIHGGLHRLELNNWLAVAGAAFAQPGRYENPMGIIDILPTVLHLVGAQPLGPVDGRILLELVDDPELAPPAVPVHTAVGSGAAILQISRVGSTRYLNGLSVNELG